MKARRVLAEAHKRSPNRCRARQPAGVTGGATLHYLNPRNRDGEVRMTEPEDEDLLDEVLSDRGIDASIDDDEPAFAERETTIATRWIAPAADDAVWAPSTSPWDRPEFRAQLDWLSRRLADAADTRKKVAALPAEKIREDRRDRILAGSTRQIEHCSHLRRQILGAVEPYSGRRGLKANLSTDIDGLLASLFGNDPRAAFLSAMTLNGIVPSSAVIAAGAALQGFHVVGDPKGTQYGWAILHRAPALGSFGSWRTGAVFHWGDATPANEATFYQDYRRALAAQPTSRAA